MFLFKVTNGYEYSHHFPATYLATAGFSARHAFASLAILIGFIIMFGGRLGFRSRHNDIKCLEKSQKAVYC